MASQKQSDPRRHRNEDHSLGQWLREDLRPEDKHCFPAILSIPQLVTDYFRRAKSQALALPKLPTAPFPSRQLQALQFSPVSLSSEARFGPLKKSGQIRTMPQYYDGRQTQRKIKQDWSLQL